MPLPDFRINPYVQPYMGGISQEFGASVDESLNRYNLATEEEDVLSYQSDTLAQNSNQFEGDQLYAKMIMNDARREIGTRAEKGDYENMGREVKRSARNFAAKAMPLIQNKALVEQFKTTLAGRQDVDEDTKAKTLALSLGSYKGLDPNNPSGSMFSGFTPSKTIDIGDKIDKYLSDWKNDGGGRNVIMPDGTIRKLTWEQAQDDQRDAKGRIIKYGIDIMKEAALADLQSDPEFLNYAQTQGTIGNQERLGRELSGGIQAGLDKHFYRIEKPELGFVTDWYQDKMTEESSPFKPTSSPGSVSPNKHRVNELKGAKLDMTGGLKADEAYFWSNDKGEYFNYVKDGKIVPVEEVKGWTQPSGAGDVGGDPKDFGYDTVKADPTMQRQYRNQVNAQFDHLEIETFGDDYAPADYTEKQKEVWAKSRLSQLSPKNRKEYRQEVLDRYNSIDDFAKVETQKWNKEKVSDVKTVGDIEQISDVGVLSTSLGGRDIYVMSPIEGINLDIPEGSDINALYAKLAEEGWKPVQMKDNGQLKYNPNGDTPAASLSLKIENTNKPGDVRDLEVAAAIENADQTPNLNYMQSVMKQALSGNSGFVPIPGSKAGYYVKNTPVKRKPGEKVPEGSSPTRTTIVRVGSDGTEIGKMSVDAFPDFFIENTGAYNELDRLIAAPKKKK